MTWLVAPHMLAAGGGRIVNVNSGAARRAGADASAYNVSKTALARVTGSTHLAGWARGIRAFDLMPGVVRTDMTESMDAHAGRTEWTDPAEVTDLVLALASGELDAWSGRFVRAGVDTVASLRRRAEAGLAPDERTLVLVLAAATPSPDPVATLSPDRTIAPFGRAAKAGSASGGKVGAPVAEWCIELRDSV